MWIIGLSGFAGTGKDTVADILVERHNYVKVSMADPLKRFCCDALDFSTDQLWGPSELRNKPDDRYKRKSGEKLTPRYALQTLGTEWGRDCYPDIWVDYAIDVAERLFDDPHLVYSAQRGLYGVEEAGRQYAGIVIPDIRFKNEVKALHERDDAVVIKIIRPGVEAPPFAHQSEEEQLSFSDNDFDYVIKNSEGFDVLHRAVTDLVYVLKSKS